MCVIIHCPTGVALPSLEEVLEAAKTNPDGAGYAFTRDRFAKGYMGDEVTGMYEEVIKKRKKLEPVSLHFRIGTSGLKDKSQTHPHEAGDVLLMHNGIIHIKPIFADESDTATVARLMSTLPAKYLLSKEGLEMIEKIFGGDKGVIISKKGKHVIINKSRWAEKHGRLYSNLNHLYRTSTTYSPPPGGRGQTRYYDYDTWEDWNDGNYERSEDGIWRRKKETAKPTQETQKTFSFSEAAQKERFRKHRSVIYTDKDKKPTTEMLGHGRASTIKEADEIENRKELTEKDIEDTASCYYCGGVLNTDTEKEIDTCYMCAVTHLYLIENELVEAVGFEEVKEMRNEAIYALESEGGGIGDKETTEEEKKTDKDTTGEHKDEDTDTTGNSSSECCPASGLQQATEIV